MLARLLPAKLALACGLAALVGGRSVAASEVHFERDIQPILVRCVVCHGSGKARAELRLDSRQGATAVLPSGNQAILPGQPGQSELLRRIQATDPKERMPPKGEPLRADQIERLRQWIAGGAEWPAHWAYRPLTKPTIPVLRTPYSEPSTPVDVFLLAELSRQRLEPAPAADPRTLLRRVYFDLIGLPPTPADVDAFLADRSPGAYERVVDRLLTSPHYGERWARHWMDVVHFAETHGHDQDRPRDHAWPYRDYLIRSFNEDKPYARFVQEQVAGDVLFPEDAWATVATGFLAAGPWDESSLRDIREDAIDREIGRYLDRDDIVTTVMATFVSTTVHCARCHDHKFDPITQDEYYGLQAVFSGTDKANRVYEPDPQVAARRRELTERKLRQAALRLAAASPPIPVLFPYPLLVLPDKTDFELAALPPSRQVYCGTSTFKPDGSFAPAKTPRTVHVLKRGDIHHPGSQARPGALSCVPGLESRFTLTNPNEEGSRRAALARWLVDPQNGLLWRSIVNRVWQWHFGRGLVDTPSDFGRMGFAPTHPELLDWLAVSLQESGGSLKHLHRLIVTSAMYRQSSRHDAACASVDADNRYLWRQNRRRLDAESIHDAVLQVSGKLDRKVGGPSVKQFVQTPGIHVTPNVDYVNFNVDDPVQYRRSVYRFLFRTLPDPFMDALDCPDGAQLTPVRNASVTAVQALSMLNDKFMIRQAEHIGEYVVLCTECGEALGALESRVVAIYRRILGRAPSSREQQLLASYVERHGLANACRVLLNSNEFVFVE